MATIVLGVVGSYFGPVGGMIGAAIGGYIDNQFIMPALFPKEPIQGPRLNDLQVTTASEGTSMKWTIGPLNRVGGTAIWMLDLKEIQTTTEAGKGGGGQSSTQYTYFGTCAIGICDTKRLPNGRVKRISKIWADTKVIYDERGDTNKYKSLQIYRGDQTTPNSLIQSHEGVDDTPHYNGLAYVVIEELALAEFANRIPNFTFLVEQENDVSLGEAIGYVLDRGGYAPEEFDVTRLSQCFKGMIVSGPQVVAQVLGPLLLAYGVGCQDRNGVLTFFTRGTEYVISVDAGDLATHDEGSDTDRPFQLTDTDAFDQPFQCTVKFVSTDNDLQQGSQIYSRANYPNKTESVIELPLTLNPATAKAIAVRTIWAAEAERQRVVLDLPPSYLTMLEGDRLEFQWGDNLYKVFASSVTTGNNGRVRVEGVLMQPETYSYVQTADGAAYGSQSAYRPPPTTAVVMDCTSLHPDVMDKIGVYHSVCATDPARTWRGAALFSSADDITYTQKDTDPFEGNIGYCINSLLPGPVEVIDHSSELLVQMLNGTLSSCTEDEMIAGVNRALVETRDGNWEVIGFQTVTYMGSNVYKITNLLRGRRGTEHLVGYNAEVGGHIPGAKFVVISLGSVKFLERGNSLLNVLEYYKAPATQGDIGRYEAIPITLQGRSAMPFAPCAVRMVKDTATNDYVFTWTRRTKSFFRLFGPSGTPFTADESPEGYILEVLVSPGYYAAVARTVTLSSPTWTYTSAMQTTDGRIAGSSACTVKIYQRSNAVGRGVPFHDTFRP